MDKLTVISGALFSIAGVFAMVSLVLPDWITSEVGGDTRLGLMKTCVTIASRKPSCFTPTVRDGHRTLHAAWLISLLCINFGTLCISLTVVLIIYSDVAHARYTGFSAMVLYCLAAVVFPMGFNMDEIGGEPYQLPNSHQVGLSYIFFVLALWITVISELLASKVCLPHF